MEEERAVEEKGGEGGGRGGGSSDSSNSSLDDLATAHFTLCCLNIEIHKYTNTNLSLNELAVSHLCAARKLLK